MKVSISELGYFEVMGIKFQIDICFNFDATHKMIQLKKEDRNFMAVSDADLQCCGIDCSNYDEFKKVIDNAIIDNWFWGCNIEYVDAHEKMYEILYKKWTHMIID